MVAKRDDVHRDLDFILDHAKTNKSLASSVVLFTKKAAKFIRKREKPKPKK